MDALVILYTAFCLACLLSPLQYVRIVRYFRTNYPDIWATFGFSGNGWWVEAKVEAAELLAQQRFNRFIESKQRLRLEDAQLNHMVAVRRTITYCGGFLFVVILGLWIWRSWISS